MKSLFVLLLLASLSLQCVLSLECPNDCSGVGKCHSATGKCECNRGFYSSDCSESVATRLPGAWISLRVVITASFIIVLVLSILSLIMNRQHKAASAESQVGYFNVRSILLISIIALGVDIVLYWGIDPSSFNFILPYKFSRVLFTLVYPLTSTVYCILLFHWAEIYHKSIATLKREKMLEKINAKYKSNITLDDILSRVQFVNRLKLPFVLFNVGAYAISFIREGLIMSHTITTKSWVTYIWMGYYVLMYGTEAIGFVVYGRRLVSIMPPNLSKKMTEVTRLIIVQSVIFFCCFLFSAVMRSFVDLSAQQYAAMEWIRFVALTVSIYMILSLFVHPSRNFPFMKFRVSSSKGSSSDKSVETDKSGGMTTTPSEDLPSPTSNV